MVENAIFTLKTQIMATLTLVIVPAKRLSDGDTQNKNSSRTQLRNEIHHNGYSGKGKRV